MFNFVLKIVRFQASHWNIYKTQFRWIGDGFPLNCALSTDLNHFIGGSAVLRCILQENVFHVRWYWRERAYTFFIWFNGRNVWISSSCLLPNVVYKLPIQSNPLECYEIHNQFEFHIFALMSLKTATYFYRSKNIYFKQCISHKFYRISREFSRFISAFVTTHIVWTIDKYMTNECRKWHSFF